MSRSAAGATSVASTGGNGNPTAPPALLTRDPAVDKFLSQTGADLVRTRQLVDNRINMLVHTGSLPGRCLTLRRHPLLRLTA
jgi:hypothetical protein